MNDKKWNWDDDKGPDDGLNTVTQALHDLTDGRLKTFRYETRVLELRYPDGLRIMLVAEDASPDACTEYQIRRVRWLAHRLVQQISLVADSMGEGRATRGTAQESVRMAKGSIHLARQALTRALERLAQEEMAQHLRETIVSLSPVVIERKDEVDGRAPSGLAGEPDESSDG